MVINFGKLFFLIMSEHTQLVGQVFSRLKSGLRRPLSISDPLMGQ